MINILERAGWIINLDKGQIPTQATMFLGFVVDSLKMEFQLPKKKIVKILDKIKEVLSVYMSG